MVDMIPYEPVARLNVTYGGQNGDYPDPINIDATDADVKQIAMESVAAGYIPGIPADPAVNFTDFVVDRFPATAELPARLMLRPKTPFGVDVKEEIYALLRSRGCQLEERAGILTVVTVDGDVWDMTIPQLTDRR